MSDSSSVPRWGVAGATLVLAAGAIVAWAAVAGDGLLAGGVIAVAAAMVAAGWLGPRWAAVMLAAWVPASLVLAGVPAAALQPRNWDLVPGLLADGWSQLATPERGLVVGDPWPLAAALLALGALWLAGAAVAGWRRPSAPRDMLAFAALTLPMVVAIALAQSNDAAWQGGIVLAAAMMWLTAGRVAPAVVLAAAVALIASTATASLAPHDRWLVPGSLFQRTPSFRSLDTDQTYGPLSTTRSGATMLEISSPRPALWRMRVLERFDGSRWVLGADGVDLPQPDAVARTTTVRVAKLESDLIVAPGEIEAVSARGRSLPADGRGRRLTPVPERGETYRVRSSVVSASAEVLRTAAAPSSEVADRYTFARLRELGMRYRHHQSEAYVGNGDGYGSSDGRPGDTADPPGYAPDGSLARTTYPPQWGPWGQVAAMADSLSAGASSQFDIVARVQRFLQSSRFQYATDVPAASDQPLMDFLLTTHRGYCQHFAGAAALLLRMAGVPTRVVVGFATGQESAPGTYRVRDKDAHAWIEVYFPGHGWVAFNPTPAAASADVPASLDLVNPAAAVAAAPDTGGGAGWLVAAGGVMAAAAFVVLRRRRRAGRRDLPGALEHVVPRVGIALRPDLTLVQVRRELQARALPRTAALADEAARERYGADGGARAEAGHPTARVWSAVVRDLGPWRALSTVLSVVRHGPTATA